MIEYARLLKTDGNISISEGISHQIKRDIVISKFSMNNFINGDLFFIKYVPFTWDSGYIELKKDKAGFNKELDLKKRDIILIQILLLLLFAFISYFLSFRALKPMQEAIQKLDGFSKDLIHDLNTPITSILLNMKILEKNHQFEGNKPLKRIKKSVEDITELHNNLRVLLQEDSFHLERQNIFNIAEELVNTYQAIYPNLRFELERFELFVKTNPVALKQILINLISNSCKYNKLNGSIKIYKSENKLFIEDGGIGIKNPNEAFNRNYKESALGNGIGLDIVKRLCDAMDIGIHIDSKVDVGSVITLEFH